MPDAFTLERGTADPPQQILYVPVRDGVVAIDLRNGAVLWRRAAVEVMGAGGGPALVDRGASGGIVFELIDRRGEVRIRSDAAQ